MLVRTILLLILTSHASIAADKDKEPESLTPEQVNAAWRIVESYGCRTASYAVDWTTDERKRAPIGRSDRITVNRGQSLSLLTRTGDESLTRLGPSLAHLPGLRTLDLGQTKVTDKSMRFG